MPVNSVSESLAEEGEQAEEEEEEGPGYTWKVGRKRISLAKFAKYYATSIPFALFVGPFVSAHVGPLNMHFGGVLTCTIVLYINGYAY